MSSQWKTCPWAEQSDDDDDDDDDVISKDAGWHACRSITRADEIKWNEMNEINVEKWWNEICGREKRKTPREKPTILRIVTTKIL